MSDLPVELFVCPDTKNQLEIMQAHDLEIKLTPIRRTGTTLPSIGVTNTILFDRINQVGFPISQGFPVLLIPEMLVPANRVDAHPVVNVQDEKYAEAYEEMLVYNKMCEDQIEHDSSTGENKILTIMGQLSIDHSEDTDSFPYPEDVWIDAKHDSLSQLDAYSYLAPVKHKTFLQLGGSGSHAVKALVAGAEKAYLLTPMIGEARIAMHLANKFGVSENLTCLIAVGEEIPLDGESIERIYSGGCFHHMRLNYAAAEMHRILKIGGRFSGVDPWKTPLHTIGTNIIGKREKSVFCKPITQARMQPVLDTFSKTTINHHGPLLRYLFLALEKLGLNLTINVMLSIGKLDDLIGRVTRSKKMGGSLMIAGEK